MQKFIVSTVMAALLFSSTAALAAPPAAQSHGAAPCANCVMAARQATKLAVPRAGLYTVRQQPCNHDAVATNVRWGAAQKSCPHCKHMG
jgi:hypothetical protein